MSALVVDASVVAKWFFPEPDTPHAVALLRPGTTLHAPDLLFSEIGNVLWKRLRRRELDRRRADAIVEELVSAPLMIVPVSSFMPAALRIANAFGRTFYDSAYVALAVEQKCRLVTADAKLLNALRNTELSRHIVGVDEEISG
ncbi:MAG: type II toxin-antitoxin system VapC family toxin [Burkholderiales bacterium]